MTRRVNYEENIFFLALVLKQLSAALKLNVDADLFRERVVGDFQFLDRSLARLYQSLKANQLMIDRLAHLRELQRLSRALTGLLDDVLEGRVSLADELEGEFELLRRLHENREKDLLELGETMAESRQKAGDHEQVVSEEEFKSLLAEGEASEQP
jgi:hypothetical protein